MIHKRIKKARLSKQFTQQEMADKLGLSRQSYNEIENGVKIPKVSYVVAISDATGFSVNWLARGDNADEKLDSIYAQFESIRKTLDKAEKSLGEL